MVLVVMLASAGTMVWVKAAQATPAPQLGLWVNGQSPKQLGVTAQVASDYAGGSNYCSYPSVTSGLGAGQTLMLAVGACTQSQAASMATTLKNAGQSSPIIRIMWEGNQNLDGWFTDWNQGTFTTAASYDAAFDTVAAGFRSVLPNAVIMYNPNDGDSNSGQTISWQAEDPGTENVIGVDAYDFSGYQPNIEAVVSYAASKGMPWALPEWGLDGSDDPTYINTVYADVTGSNCSVEAYFDYAGSINSWLPDFPKSLAAYTADFGGSSASPGSSTTTTTVKSAPPVTVAPTTTTTVKSAPPVTVAPTTTTTVKSAPPSSTTTTVVKSTPPVTVAATGAPGAPTNVKASVSGSTVTISWTNVSNALGDDVFRDGSEIAWPGWPSALVTSYQDTGVAPGVHTYSVAGYNSSGVGSLSTTVSVTVAGGTTAAPPTTTGGTTPTTSTPPWKTRHYR
jgi:hypothetical protein